MARRASAVHLKGSGANKFVISRHCNTPPLFIVWSVQAECDPVYAVWRRLPNLRAHQTCKWQFPDEKFCAPLVSSNFSESNCARAKPMRFCAAEKDKNVKPRQPSQVQPLQLSEPSGGVQLEVTFVSCRCSSSRGAHSSASTSALVWSCLSGWIVS